MIKRLWIKLLKWLIKMAQQDLNYGTSYNDPSAESARTTFDKCQDNFDELYAADVSLTALIGGFRNALIEVTDWDMDATSSKSIVWALPANSVIVGINVLIRTDASANDVRPLDDGSGVANYGGFRYDGDSFELFRVSGELFDSTDYNTSTGNRGWIWVTYYTT